MTTVPSDSQTDEYPVAIVGGGPVGLTMSLLLSQHGVRNVVLERHPNTSIHPKAIGLNQRTVEVFRSLGLEEEIYLAAAPPQTCSRTGWYTSFGGPTELHGRRIAVRDAWGGGSYREEYAKASPSRYSMLPQIRLEPILKKAAESKTMTTMLWDAPVIDLTQESEWASLTVGTPEESRTVRAKYVIGADGGRFMAESLGIPMNGPTNLVDMVTAHFSADLSPHLLDKECLIHWFVNPDFGGSIGSGYLYHLGPWEENDDSREWVFASGFAADDPDRFEPELMKHRIHRSLGLPDLEMDIHSISHWYIQAVVAERFRQDRFFLVGDAAHRIPPWGALGLNTGVQDAHNLAWKLAIALSNPELAQVLETYESERRPIALHVAERSLSNFQNHGGVVDVALGLSPNLPGPEGWEQLRTFYSNSDEGQRKRDTVDKAMTFLDEEFHAHGVENGYTYVAGAIAETVETEQAIPEDRLIYHPSSAPGHRVPHSWLRHSDGRRASTLDLSTTGRFILLVDHSVADWKRAVHEAQHPLSKLIDIVPVGNQGAWRPEDSSWEEVRGVATSGAILVRPDTVVAWRSEHLPAAPTGELESALSAISALKVPASSQLGGTP